MGLSTALRLPINKVVFITSLHVLDCVSYNDAMPLISFKKNRSPLFVSQGTNLMKSLLEAGLPVASSCDGEGVCAKCRILVLEGAEHLSAETDLEQFLKEKNKIPDHIRISCQTRVLGDITIDASYW